MIPLAAVQVTHPVIGWQDAPHRCGITSDANNPNDPEYIVRLVGTVVPAMSLPNARVSVETVKLVNSLPAEYAPPTT